MYNKLRYELVPHSLYSPHLANSRSDSLDNDLVQMSKWKQAAILQTLQFHTSMEIFEDLYSNCSTLDEDTPKNKAIFFILKSVGSLLS